MSPPSASICSPRAATCAVAAYVTPAQFDAYRDYGLSIGFKMVFSGPLVRSSYMADLVNEEARASLVNFSLALLSAVLLVLIFPNSFSLRAVFPGLLRWR